MQSVPKMMGHIKQYWNPSTLLVSFKLETDMSILEQKALGAITNYGVDMVVANQLATRREQVVVYHKEADKAVLRINPEVDTQVDYISKLIVDHITRDVLKDDGQTDLLAELPEPRATPEHGAKTELYVTGINFETQEDALRAHFEPHGSLTKVKLIFDRSRRSKGKAFVEYASPADAETALEQAHGSVLEGRELTVEF